MQSRRLFFVFLLASRSSACGSMIFENLELDYKGNDGVVINYITRTRSVILLILFASDRTEKSRRRTRRNCRHAAPRGRRWTTCFYRFGIGANALKGAVRLSHTNLLARDCFAARAQARKKKSMDNT